MKSTTFSIRSSFAYPRDQRAKDRDPRPACRSGHVPCVVRAVPVTNNVISARGNVPPLRLASVVRSGVGAFSDGSNRAVAFAAEAVARRAVEHKRIRPGYRLDDQRWRCSLPFALSG